MRAVPVAPTHALDPPLEPSQPRCAGGCGRVDVDAARQLAAVGRWDFPEGWREPRLCPEDQELFGELLTLFRDYRGEMVDFLRRYRTALAKEQAAV